MPNMSNDVTVSSLNPDEDEPSSPSSTYNLMASLAEHSYCASAISSSTERVIGDIFEITSSENLELVTDVSSSVSFPVGMMGDVNLDGLDYPVPSVSVNENGNSTELENVWTGLNSDTNTTVVEIAATSSSMDEREEYSGSDGKSSPPPAKKCRRSNSRRKDFIQDFKKRKAHFDLYYKKLLSQLYRVKCRTGCESNVSVSYEGKNYDYEGKPVNLTRGPLRENEPKTASINETKNHEMEDHRYAATMLTQNVQSSSVRDHQYDEKSTTECEEDDDIRRPQNRYNYKYDYIKLRWDRDQTLGKMVQSVFFSKNLLEQRTGASIKILLDYEGCAITEDNYESANHAITAHRKSLKYRNFNLAPAAQKVALPVQQNGQHSSPTPVTFIIPNSCFSPLRTLPSSPGSLQDISLTSVTSDTDFPNPNCVATFSILKNMQVKPVDETPENHSIMISTDNTQETVGEVIMDGNNITTICASSPGFSPPEEVGDISEMLVFPNSSSQNSSPEMTVSVSSEMKESSTNTEPICSICSDSCEKSAPTTHGRTGGENSSTKAFWIRCNDPFCYDVVHASCVGFVVTHKSHLKQLPAFYCKLHR